LANKVTHIINCASKQLRNFWESLGVKYLAFPWLDNDIQVILDTDDKVADQCFDFIEEAMTKGDSILIHSVRGQGRTCTVLSAYMIRKYRWTLLKALEYLNFRIPDLEIRETFVKQLTGYENRLAAKGLEPKTSKWSEVLDKVTTTSENEELLLRNTYLNAQMRQFIDFGERRAAKKSSKVKWIDEEEKPLVVVIEKKPSNEEPQANEKKHRVILLIDTLQTKAESNKKNLRETKQQDIETVEYPRDSAQKIVLQSSAEIDSSNHKPKRPMYDSFVQKNNEVKEQIIDNKSNKNFIIDNPLKEATDTPPNNLKTINKPDTLDIQQGVLLPSEGQSAIRKIIQAKKARTPLRSISVIVRRKSPNISLGKKVPVLERELKDKNSIKKVKTSSSKGNSKPKHLRGKSLESPNKTIKFAKKTENKGRPVKKRQKIFSKTVNLDNILKTVNESVGKKQSMRNISPKQAIKQIKTHPIGSFVPIKSNYF